MNNQWQNRFPHITDDKSNDKSTQDIGEKESRNGSQERGRRGGKRCKKRYQDMNENE